MDHSPLPPQESSFALSPSLTPEKDAVLSPSPLAHFTPQQVDVLRRTIAKGATDDEFFMFASLCARYQLDPFNREVWFVKYGPTPLIMTSRDGYLKICQRDPDFLGINSAAVREGDTFEMCPAEGRVIHRFGAKRGAILGAWAMVKHRRREPSICFADFAEYDKSNERGGDVWKRYPSAMICKVAEVMALKRQGGIAGLVTQEEMRLETARPDPARLHAEPGNGHNGEISHPEQAEPEALTVEFRLDPSLKALHDAVKGHLKHLHTDPQSAGRWLAEHYRKRRVIDLSDAECRDALQQLAAETVLTGQPHSASAPSSSPPPSNLVSVPVKTPPAPREERLYAAQKIIQSIQATHQRGSSASGTARERLLEEIEELEMRLWPDPLTRPQQAGRYRRNYMQMPSRLEECEEDQMDSYRQALETHLTAESGA
jgi:phage recombination protein Bet